MKNAKTPATESLSSPETFTRDIYPSFLLRRTDHKDGEGCGCGPIVTRVGSVTIYQHRNPAPAPRPLEGRK